MRAAGGACAWKGGEGGAPRASRWARPFARVRAPGLFPHVPRATRPLPAGSARLPLSRRVPSRSLRASHSPRLLPRPSPRPRLSSPEAQPRPLGAASQASSPFFRHFLPFPALLSHPVHPESLDTKQAGLRRELEKWRCRAWIIPSTAPPAPVRR